MLEPNISNNTLAFIALANEYCHAIENIDTFERQTLIDTMLRLLPRIYISASDVKTDDIFSDGYIPSALQETQYDDAQRAIAAMLGEDDTYLDVLMDEMRFSDTPIAVSISEQLADIFQVLYNFVDYVRDTTPELVNEAAVAVAEDFAQYWSRTLCNAFRAINALKHT